MKFVLDAFGGDNCPQAIIDGIVLAQKKLPEIEYIVTGNKKEIEQYIAEKKYKIKNMEIIDALEIITCNDVPTVAIRVKKNSSLVKALDLLNFDTRNVENMGAMFNSCSSLAADFSARRREALVSAARSVLQ